MEFTLTIRLGNAEMQTGGDIAHALRQVADRINPDYHMDDGWQHATTILDLNGERVGQWKIKEES